RAACSACRRRSPWGGRPGRSGGPRPSGGRPTPHTPPATPCPASPRGFSGRRAVARRPRRRPGGGGRPRAPPARARDRGGRVQLGGAYYSYEWFEAAALLVELAGLALLLGGWPALRWAGPSIAFLIFMVPLPYRLEGALSHPLQRIGTVASTYALQTLGLPAV